MTQKVNKTRKIPARSKMTDEQLATLIKQAQAEHPEQFSKNISEGGISSFKNGYIPPVTEVISIT